MRSILGIDTAAPDGSVALAVNGRSVGVERLLPREHSSGLALAAERLLGSRSLRLRDLAGVAVSEGPGSFTGLRIGLAWAKGLALGLGLPLALVSSHRAASHAHRDASLWIATLLPSERGFVEIALWNGSGDAPVHGPARVEIEDAVPEVIERAGTGARVELRPSTAALLAALAEDAAEHEASIRPPEPLAAAVAEIGDRLLEAGARADLVLASPAYGREPNARKPGS